MNYKSYSYNCKPRNTARILVFLEHIQIGIAGIQKCCILYIRFRNTHTSYRLKNNKNNIPNILSMSYNFYSQSRKAHIFMSPNKIQFCIRGIAKSCRWDSLSHNKHIAYYQKNTQINNLNIMMSHNFCSHHHKPTRTAYIQLCPKNNPKSKQNMMLNYNSNSLCYKQVSKTHSCLYCYNIHWYIKGIVFDYIICSISKDSCIMYIYFWWGCTWAGTEHISNIDSHLQSICRIDIAGWVHYMFCSLNRKRSSHLDIPCILEVGRIEDSSCHGKCRPSTKESRIWVSAFLSSLKLLNFNEMIFVWLL